MTPEVAASRDQRPAPCARSPLRLRWAVGLIFALVLGAGVLGIYAAAEGILMRGFREVERAETARNVRRAQAALQRTIDSLSVKASDWGAWDDTYRFVQDRNEEYVESNLTPESLANLQIDAILFFDEHGQLVKGRAINPDGTPRDENDDDTVRSLRALGLLHHDSPDSAKRGLIPVRDSFVLAASRPIVTSENEGPVRGSVVFVRALSNELVAQLADQTELELRVLAPGGSRSLTDLIRDELQDLAAHDHWPVVREEGPDAILGFSILHDAADEPAALLRVQTPREIHAQGRASVRWLMVSVIGLGLLVTASVILVLDRLVIRRLERMSVWAARISAGAPPETLPERGVQELATLARSINRMVETIISANDELAARADELHAQSAQLEESRRIAEAANRAKSEFLASMSHEIRTPLTSVLGYAEMMLEPGTSEQDRTQCARLVHSAGTSLLSIVNDILDISKIEAGHLAVERAPVSPAGVVVEVMTMLRGRAEAKGLVFAAECLTSIPVTVVTDPVRLRQILVNIAGNAIKFTERGEVRVGVGTRRDEDGRDMLVLEVRDTGPGISPEHAARLFRPFEQGDTSTTRRFGGTGLGLHISKRLAEALGGTIRVRSTPGEGTTFIISIDPGPLENAWWTESIATDQPADGGDTRPAPPGASLQGRILVADDSPDIRRLVAHLLRRAGAEVHLAEHGLQAVEMLRDADARGEPYALLLLDMHMPVMDGYEAAARIRASGTTTPVVALTAQALEGDRAACLQAGCDDFARKPIDRATLLRVCEQWLRPRPLQRDAA